VTARIFFKLLSGIFALLLAALITVDYFASKVAAANYIDNLRREMADKGRIMAMSMGSDSNLYRSKLKMMAKAARARMTLVAPDGRVVADSEADPAVMENHRNRPELIDAFQGRQGSSIRHSPTLGVDFLYVAAPLPAGALRLAVPLAEINQQVNSVRNKILYSTALAFLPAVLIAALLAHYLSRRFATITSFAGELAKGNFRARLTDFGRNEFGQLAHKLNETGQNLQKIAQPPQCEDSDASLLER
jgi:two-component system phosphate regulon sensor histidine kinase PhoR